MVKIVQNKFSLNLGYSDLQKLHLHVNELPVTLFQHHSKTTDAETHPPHDHYNRTSVWIFALHVFTVHALPPVCIPRL